MHSFNDNKAIPAPGEGNPRRDDAGDGGFLRAVYWRAGVVSKQDTAETDLLNAGYTHLCLDSHEYANPVLLDFLNRGRHETKKFGDRIGIRCKEPFPVDFQCPWTTIKANDLQPLRLTAAVERFRSSYFGEYYYNHHPLTTSWKEVAKTAELLPKSNPSPFDWELLARLITRCESRDLLRCLEEIAFPVFFRWKPHGCIQVYLQDFLSEKHFAESRILRVVSTLQIDEGLSTAPQSLTDWQTTNPLTMFELMLEWCGSITYPVIQNYILGPLGLTLSFVDDEIAINTPPSYPSSFSDIKHSKSGFGVFTPPLQFGPDKIHAPAETHHGRAVWDEEFSGAEGLHSWVARKSHKLISSLTNIENYGGSSVSGVDIDLSMPFEQTATLDRVFRRALWLNTAEQRSISRLPIFEIADSIAAIKGRWTKTKDRFLFKELFSFDYFESTLSPALLQIPSPWGKRLWEIAVHSYKDVHQVMLESIWSTERLNQNGVNLSKSLSPAQFVSLDEFVTSSIRDLRNTHHGYLPERAFPQIRNRLCLISGKVSPQISIFPTIWLFAMLVDPKSIIGWDVPL